MTRTACGRPQRKKVWGGDVVTLLLCLTIAHRAAGQGAVPLSQRRINEIGAPLYVASRTLIEDTGLRLPNEALPDYARRLAALLPNETAAQHTARIAGYLTVLQKATDAVAGLRYPALCDTSLANTKIWKKMLMDSTVLTRRMEHLRAAVQAQKSGLSTELTATIYALLAVRDALRDARP